MWVLQTLWWGSGGSKSSYWRQIVEQQILVQLCCAMGLWGSKTLYWWLIKYLQTQRWDLMEDERTLWLKLVGLNILYGGSQWGINRQNGEDQPTWCQTDTTLGLKEGDKTHRCELMGGQWSPCWVWRRAKRHDTELMEGESSVTKLEAKGVKRHYAVSKNCNGSQTYWGDHFLSYRNV